MDLELKHNRTGITGPFGGYQWEGSNQVFKPSAGMLPGISRLEQRSSAQPNDYKSPVQFGQMLDAAMAHQMSRQGIGQGNPTPESQGFGPASGTREGMFSQAFVPPPPPSVAPPAPPPPQFMQPNMANNWGRGMR